MFNAHKNDMFNAHKFNFKKCFYNKKIKKQFFRFKKVGSF